MTTLTTAQIDRAVGVLLATAAGDALGAPYEFGPPRGPELKVAMETWKEIKFEFDTVDKLDVAHR